MNYIHTGSTSNGYVPTRTLHFDSDFLLLPKIRPNLPFLFPDNTRTRSPLRYVPFSSSCIVVLGDDTFLDRPGDDDPFNLRCKNAFALSVRRAISFLLFSSEEDVTFCDDSLSS